MLGSFLDYNSIKNSSDQFSIALKRARRFGAHSGEPWKLVRLVNEASKRLNIPDPVSQAVIQYHNDNRERLFRLRRRELASALLYIHMKNYLKNHRALREIAAETGANLKVARRYVMELGFDGLKAAYRPAEDYVSTYAARMNVGIEVMKRGMEFANLYRERGIGSSGPRTVAACALYLACKENGHRYTQKEIASIFGYSEYTIREVSASMRGPVR
ncbi:MAG: hypothetical protein JRM94_04710 [Nitrososphaerota archaeon]|nr:hypothetical protein [Nitrososphaerota archaeon]